MNSDIVMTNNSKLRKVLRAFAYAALSLAVVGMLAYFAIGNYRNREIELEKSGSDVSANYIHKLPDDVVLKTNSSDIDEEEFFTRLDYVCFNGIVRDVKNISVTNLGSSVCYAVVKIEIKHIYFSDTGDESLSVGDVLPVFLHFPVVGTDYDGDTFVSCRIEKGMEGIFMPILLDDSTHFSSGESYFYPSDIAPYALADGSSLFLQTEDGVLYDKNIFTSLDSPDNLPMVDRYLTKMYKKYIHPAESE